MGNEKILHGSIDKRFVVVCFRNKVQEYAFFDSTEEAFNWWQDHKHPFFETDRPKGWGVSFALTYDKLEQKIIQWNTLYLTKQIVDEYVEQMNTDLELSAKPINELNKPTTNG